MAQTVQSLTVDEAIGAGDWNCKDITTSSCQIITSSFYGETCSGNCLMFIYIDSANIPSLSRTISVPSMPAGGLNYQFSLKVSSVWMYNSAQLPARPTDTLPFLLQVGSKSSSIPIPVGTVETRNPLAEIRSSGVINSNDLQDPSTLLLTIGLANQPPIGQGIYEFTIDSVSFTLTTQGADVVQTSTQAQAPPNVLPVSPSGSSSGTTQASLTLNSTITTVISGTTYTSLVDHLPTNSDDIPISHSSTTEGGSTDEPVSDPSRINAKNGVFIGAFLGVIFFILMIVLGCIFLRRRRQKQNAARTSRASVMIASMVRPPPSVNLLNEDSYAHYGIAPRLSVDLQGPELPEMLPEYHGRVSGPVVDDEIGRYAAANRRMIPTSLEERLRAAGFKPGQNPDDITPQAWQQEFSVGYFDLTRLRYLYERGDNKYYDEK